MDAETAEFNFGHEVRKMNNIGIEDKPWNVSVFSSKTSSEKFEDNQSMISMIRGVGAGDR